MFVYTMIKITQTVRLNINFCITVKELCFIVISSDDWLSHYDMWDAIHTTLATQWHFTFETKMCLVSRYKVQFCM